MEFRFTTEQQAFRQEVRDFLASEWRDDDEGYGMDEKTFVRKAREFEKKLAARGWLTLAWPKEYGGQGADHITQLIYKEESALAGTPTISNQGVGLIGPCLMVHGTEAQKKRFLPKIANADELWCQGFSEPGAGSDLASLQTRAVRDGDDYVINGQKIWTSRAHYADYIHVLTRTDPDAPKHRGISYFLLDMKTPGITLQPIKQMTGQSGFNQTFFENVRVPRENMLGEENRGWYVATTTLDFERSGVGMVVGASRTLRKMIRYATDTKVDGRRLIDRPNVRMKLAELRVATEAGRWLSYRVAWMQSKGLVPNYEASMSKMYGSELGQRMANTAVNVLGMYGQLELGSPYVPLGAFARNALLGTIPSTIAAGSSEIQRNVIATRGLGLPRD